MGLTHSVTNKEEYIFWSFGTASVLCLCAALTACGQKGNLYLPNDPEFQQRAKLPEIVRRQLPGNTAMPATNAASAPANAASAAGR